MHLDDVARLAADLTPFTTAAAERVLGEKGAAALSREQRVPGLTAARAAGLDPAALLARLFMLGDTLTAVEAATAFPALSIDGALRLGIVRSAVGAVRAGNGEPPASVTLASKSPASVTPASEPLPHAVVAAVDLRPIDADGTEVWLTADLGERVTGRAVAPDHVLGVGGASLTLAGITPRGPVVSALDLGTGCGIQAALLAAHADRVTATDISTRALAFARLNAALNGGEWDLREGSLFDPVAGERFDLIVSNPPFVITPASAHAAGLPVMEYREAAGGSVGRSGGDGEGSSSGGDRLLAALLGALPDHLTKNGTAVLLANWEHRRGEDWRERVAALAPGLDLWVIQREVLDPAEYVELWLRDGGLSAQVDRARYEAVYAAWIADFERRGVEAVGFGYVLAAPASAVRSVRVEEATGPAAQPLGAHLAACFAAQRSLAGLDGEAMGALRPAVAPDVTVEHHLVPGGEHPASIVLRQGGGLGRTYQADTALAGLVSAADGELTLAQLSGALAALLEEGEETLRIRLYAQVAELLAAGLLTAVARNSPDRS